MVITIFQRYSLFRNFHGKSVARSHEDRTEHAVEDSLFVNYFYSFLVGVPPGFQRTTQAASIKE